MLKFPYFESLISNDRDRKWNLEERLIATLGSNNDILGFAGLIRTSPGRLVSSLSKCRRT